MITLLSTKPLRIQNIQQLHNNGILVDIMPFIEIEYLEKIDFPNANGRRLNAVFTSVNAVKAIIPFIDSLPAFENIFCISGQTSFMVKQYFDAPIISKPYAKELVQEIAKYASKLPIWFFKGDKALPTIPTGLKENAIPFESVLTYRNIATPYKVSTQYDCILFFSPSAVDSYLQLNELKNNTSTFAIGTTTANSLNGKSNTIILASEPTEEAMITAVLNYKNNK